MQPPPPNKRETPQRTMTRNVSFGRNKAKGGVWGKREGEQF
jgi:hypothetical protein